MVIPSSRKMSLTTREETILIMVMTVNGLQSFYLQLCRPEKSQKKNGDRNPKQDQKAPACNFFASERLGDTKVVMRILRIVNDADFRSWLILRVYIGHMYFLDGIRRGLKLDLPLINCTCSTHTLFS
jgi:hypothetical protein